MTTNRFTRPGKVLLINGKAQKVLVKQITEAIMYNGIWRMPFTKKGGQKAVSVYIFLTINLNRNLNFPFNLRIQQV